MSLEEGSILHDRYRIDGQLGKGGMGAVYLAFDQTLQIKVALKENLNLNPESERQFHREASLLASLRHPNLPRVTDHFILEGRQYLVMDYIEGEDLHARARRQAPTARDVLKWADAVSDALVYLHSRKPPVIHRDIKPSNIKVQPDGNVVLVDFGLAKVFDHQQTTTGARGLTPGFSPPEQYGSGRTDARSDQYALAATMYNLLTGRAPADSIERMMGNEELKPARELNPAVPPNVEACLERALSISQDQRFPDVASFQAALKGVGASPTLRADLPTMPKKSAGRPAWLWLGLGGAALLGVVVVGGGVALALAGGLPGVGAGAATATESQVAVVNPTASAAPDTATPQPTVPPTDASTATPVPTETPTQAPIVVGGGGRIVFVSDRGDGNALQVWTMNPDGTQPRQITFGPGDKHQPRWSPDGKRILYVAPGGRDDFGNDLGQDIWLINLDGTQNENITHHAGDDVDPAWSPDGRLIAFTSDRINELNQVFLLNTSCFDAGPEACWSEKPTNISAGFAVEYSPAWSPDGQQIAVSASINGAPGRIYVHIPRPGEPERFDRTDHIIGAENLDWSPDGSAIVFAWIQPTMNEIYLARLSDHGANPLKLTNSLGNKEPAYSVDGQWIAFTSTRDQNPEIYIMTANGSNQSNISNSPTSRDMQPDWQPQVEP
jgi:Tol biopolymer transport system component/predicted Ser/Thr protein kinase